MRRPSVTLLAQLSAGLGTVSRSFAEQRNRSGTHEANQTVSQLVSSPNGPADGEPASQPVRRDERPLCRSTFAPDSDGQTDC